jgi:hypothetical protein
MQITCHWSENNTPKPFSGRFHCAFLAFRLAFALELHSLNFMDQLNVTAMLKLQRAFVNERKWKKFHIPKNSSGVIPLWSSNER